MAEELTRGFSLTKWMDPILDFFAKLAGLEGIQREDYKAMSGAEALATILETVNDLATKGWLNKAISLFGALICGAVAFGLHAKLNPRLKMEILQIGNHLLSRIVDPKPRDLIELKESLEELVRAIKLGDWKLAFKSGLRLAEEHKEVLRRWGILKEGVSGPKLEIKEIPKPKEEKKPSRVKIEFEA